MKIRILVAVLAVCFGAVLFASGCAKRQPLPQPRRVVNPEEVEGAYRSAKWDIGAIAYKFIGEQGMDYNEAGLAPVFLVFKNESQQKPVVRVEEVRGLTPDGEYLAYSVDEAVQLVFASESFSNTAENIARSGGLAGAAGAGLGALIGLIGGGDNIWKGAVIGGTIGLGAGGAAGAINSEAELRKHIKGELGRYAWTDDPIPPVYTKVGYLYFPAEVNVTKVRILVRDGDDVQGYIIPVADAPEVAPAKK